MLPTLVANEMREAVSQFLRRLFFSRRKMRQQVRMP